MKSTSEKIMIIGEIGELWGSGSLIYNRREKEPLLVLIKTLHFQLHACESQESLVPSEQKQGL